MCKKTKSKVVFSCYLCTELTFKNQTHAHISCEEKDSKSFMWIQTFLRSRTILVLQDCSFNVLMLHYSDTTTTVLAAE